MESLVVPTTGWPGSPRNVCHMLSIPLPRVPSAQKALAATGVIIRTIITEGPPSRFHFMHDFEMSVVSLEVPFSKDRTLWTCPFPQQPVWKPQGRHLGTHKHKCGRPPLVKTARTLCIRLQLRGPPVLRASLLGAVGCCPPGEPCPQHR